MPTPVAQEAPACAQSIEKRLPLVIVVDRSDYRHRDEYLACIEALETTIASDAFAAATIETAVIGFGPVEVLQSFRPVRYPGTTYLGRGEPGPIGSAIHRAHDLIAERREQYRHLGVRCIYRPVIVLLTDKRLDTTNDADRAGCEALRAHLDARRVHCWPLVPVGVSPQTSTAGRLSGRRSAPIPTASGRGCLAFRQHGVFRLRPQAKFSRRHRTSSRSPTPEIRSRSNRWRPQRSNTPESYPA